MNIFTILLSIALALVPALKQELTMQQIDEARILVEQRHEAIREEARIRAEEKAKADEQKKQSAIHADIVSKTEPISDSVELKEEVITETEKSDTDGEMELIGNYNLTFYCPCPQHCNNSLGAAGVGLTPYRSVAMTNVPMGTEVYIEGSPGYDGWYIVQDISPSGIIDIFVNHHSEIPGWGTARVKVYRR